MPGIYVPDAFQLPDGVLGLQRRAGAPPQVLERHRIPRLPRWVSGSLMCMYYTLVYKYVPGSAVLIVIVPGINTIGGYQVKSRCAAAVYRVVHSPHVQRLPRFDRAQAWREYVFVFICKLYTR